MHYKPFVFIILIPLALVTFLGGCSSSEEQQANYLNRAQDQYDAGDFKKARLEIKNVFQINRYNSPARYLLALINMKNSDWRDAQKNLVLAIKYDPDFIDARIRLGGLYLSVYGSDENILEQADLVLAIDPGNADAHALRSSVFRRQGKDADAVNEAQLGLNSVPGHVGASTALAAVYIDEDPDLALTYINASIEMNPSDQVIKGIKLLLATRQGNHEAAIAVYKELIAADPKDITYYPLLIGYLRSQDRGDEADVLLRNLATSTPDSVELKVWLSQNLSRETLSDIAEGTIKSFIIDHPEEHKLRFALASVYLASQRPADADIVFQDIIALDKNGADAQSARGAIATFAWTMDKDRATSEAMVDEILVIEESNATALGLKATFKLLDGDSIGAITDLRTALKSDPTSVGTALMLGDAYTANNSLDLALDAYRNALELSPNDAVAVQKISQLLVNQNEYTAAESILTSYLAQAPKNVEARVLLIESYILQQRWNDALASVNELADQELQLARAIYLRGRVRYAQKEYSDAIDAFEEVLQIEPNAIEALSYLVKTMLVAGEVTAAEEYLSAHIKAYPQQEHSLELQGAVYLASGDPDAAIESYRAALAINPQRLSAQINLGKALQTNGDLVGALKAYEDGLQLSPKNVDLLNLTAGLLGAMKRYQDAADMYNAVLTIDDDQAVASNNLAMLLIDHLPSDTSYSRALQLTTDFEDTNVATLLDTRGWVYYQMEDYASAKRLLIRAVAADDTESVFRFHLGMTYYKLGDKKSAKVELEKSLANEQTFTGSDEASKLLEEL